MYNVFQKIKFSLMKIKEHDNECMLVECVYLQREKFKQYKRYHKVFLVCFMLEGHIYLIVPFLTTVRKVVFNLFYFF